MRVYTGPVVRSLRNFAVPDDWIDFDVAGLLSRCSQSGDKDDALVTISICRPNQWRGYVLTLGLAVHDTTARDLLLRRDLVAAW